ncbi:MAG TPA: MMPL family transporter [Actinomycetota bacterium]|nr:MMPL family transporter [Actinomycetota bacterium]
MARATRETNARGADRAVGDGSGSSGDGSGKGGAGGGVFMGLGRLAVRRPWYVVAVWVIAFVVMAGFAQKLQGRLGQGGWNVPGSESLRVQNLVQQRFGEQAATAIIAIHGSDATVSDPTYRAVLARVNTDVSGVPHVGAILWANDREFVSADGHTTYLVVGLTGDQNQTLVTARAVALAAARDVPAGFKVETGGASAFYNRFNDISKEGLAKAEEASFPITLAVLLLAFATVVAAGLPLLLAIVSLVVTLGALYFLAGITNMSVYVTNTASVIGIGVGIDYALFVVTRFREELRRGRSVADAIPLTLATSGRAVTLSGLTVIIALFGMFLVNVQAFRSMAIGSMSVVAVAVLGALTLIPALLRLLGHRVNALKIPWLSRQASPGTGFWHQWAMAVMRRPWTYTIACLVVLLTLAAPLFSMRMGQSGPKTLPPGEGPRVANEMLAAGFGAGVTGPVSIVVTTPGGATTPANLATIDRLSRALQADPGTASVTSLTTLVPGASVSTYERLYAGGPTNVPAPLARTIGSLVDWKNGAGMTRVTVVGKASPETRQAESFVQGIRDDVIPAAGLAGRAIVGGETAFNLDLEHAITGTLPFMVLTVLALSFILLTMAFRSLILPLKAIVMNLLSVGAAYGLMTAIFQWGWGQSVLGFTSEGNISLFVPMFLFCILFGLSMDYEVFLMTRIREEYYRTGSNELAVARGLESSARPITSAALIMVTVFAAFASSRLLPFKEMGFGLAAAVFIDATIVRTVLVPAAMKLMGDWNWWMPRWLDRLLPAIALETEREPEATSPDLERV